MKFIEKSIAFLFYLLFFLVPLVLWPYSYEIFEFNKMIAVYIFTILIVSLWISRSILNGKFIIRRTILDIPLLIFLGTQLVSTLISVDLRTSFLGYYSRFNGGFFSILSFSLLYWTFVSNIKPQKTINYIKSLIFSSFIVSSYAILEHFGIDKHIWVQDVQERVFSTLGQPNWLAAWLVAIIPFTWFFIIKSKRQKFVFAGISILIFLAILYTKSRSGFLGFGLATLIFWSGVFYLIYKKTLEKNNILKIFFLLNLIFLIINIFTKTPWTPDISGIFSKKTIENFQETNEKTTGTVLETGGTESSKIRKLVWKGAVDVWKTYPILGSGVETFAFSFYKERPKEHNLVSEWDFLYNKAHNEYLNFLATTGVLGLSAYLFLIGSIIFVFVKNIKEDEENRILNLALLSGFTSILITNFFGFSVVAVNIQFFIYPALCISLKEDEVKKEKTKKENLEKIKDGQKVLIITLAIAAIFLINLVVKYWLADLNFAKGKNLNDVGYPLKARDYLQKAVNLSPKESIFWSKLAENSADISRLLKEKEDTENLEMFINSTLNETKTAESLSPNNLNVLRQITTTFIKLSNVDINYLIFVKEYLEKAIILSPNDAKLIFNLGLIYSNSIDTKKAIETLEKAVELKDNYKQARSTLATLYLKENESKKAEEQLEYILNNIDPNDQTILERLKKLE